MVMRIDPADSAFSIYIRLRDKYCVRCGSPVEFNAKGLPVSHQCSHYYGRTRETVRFDERNGDTLCHGCHRFWEKEDREAYRAFKVKQLGASEFIRLRVAANLTGHKDRQAARIYWRARIAEDFGIKL